MPTKTNNPSGDEVGTDVSRKNNFRVIGIGASAGGLEALKLFFDNVPAYCKHAFVIVQHLSPDYKSLMAELLAKNTVLHIHEVKNNMTIKAGSIYLIPAKKNMTYRKGKLLLTDRPKTHDLNLPIDMFFHSLAQELKTLSVGIVLSGTGTDGSRGVRAIKETGGTVIVQSPLTAKFDGMPNSAIAMGGVDYVLPVEQIPLELFDSIDTLRGRNLKNSESDLMDEPTLVKILDLINERVNIDFKGYKRPTLIRRIAKRMGVKKYKVLKEYYNHMIEDDSEIQLLYREFLIGVTQFFRDPEAFQIMGDKIIPAMVNAKNTGEEIKIWSIGCSTGEEVYSLAILFDEVMHREDRSLNIKIFATDIEQGHLDMASQAMYTDSIEADVSVDRLKKYFSKKGDYYNVSQKIRNRVIFSCHDILKDPPFNKLDLVVCRNMLIYVGTEMQQNVMSKVHFGLNKDSILFLGPSETVGESDYLFKTVDKKWRIYSSNDVPSRLARNIMEYPDIMKRGEVGRGVRSVAHPKKCSDDNLSDILNEALLDQFGAAGVYIDQYHNIMHAIGDFKKYIEIPENQFSLNLLKMLPENLAIPTTTAIRKVIKKKGRIIYKGAKWQKAGEQRTISILVNAFELNSTGLNCFLVVFIEEKVEKASASVIKDIPEDAKSVALLAEMEEELKLVKENLQITVEELETSNEELQATNEELLSSNEELQSTNEELQSVNEELHSVNAEYQLKIGELLKLNDDIENLIRSTNIPTIFLDVDLSIRKFTPNITEQFNVSDTDIGRPISHFTSTFGQEESSNLLKIIERVIQSRESEQKKILTSAGKWYLQRIFPFIDHNNNQSEGVVITFVDITEMTLSQEKLLQKTVEIETTNKQLSRFNNAAVGREERMIELKKIINEQCERLKEAPMFNLSFIEPTIE